MAHNHACGAHALPHRPSRRLADAGLRVEVRHPAAAQRAAHTSWAPSATPALLERLAAAYGDWLTAPGFPLAIREMTPADVVDATGRCSPDAARRSTHTGECGIFRRARRAADRLYGRHRLRSDALAAWARGCDVLAVRVFAAGRDGDPDAPHARAVRRAGRGGAPKHLVLTHFYPPVERVDIRGASVGAHFAGPVTLADDGWYFDIEEELMLVVMQHGRDAGRRSSASSRSIRGDGLSGAPDARRAAHDGRPRRQRRPRRRLAARGARPASPRSSTSRKPYKQVSREWRAENTLVTIAPGVVVRWRRTSSIIAGPCSVEIGGADRRSPRARCATAGATALRGGAFKPRSSPYSFQGLGKQGLELLALARAGDGAADRHRGAG